MGRTGTANGSLAVEEYVCRCTSPSSVSAAKDPSASQLTSVARPAQAAETAGRLNTMGGRKRRRRVPDEAPGHRPSGDGKRVSLAETPVEQVWSTTVRPRGSTRDRQPVALGVPYSDSPSGLGTSTWAFNRGPDW